MNLVEFLIKEGWLKTPEIIKAFRKIKREDFLPDEMKSSAGLNEALPIGFGQTISQPLTVAFMLELLQPTAGDKILDVGSGSGWTSALLAKIVGKRGRIIAIEKIKELKEFGEKNIAKYGFIKKEVVVCVLGDGSRGTEGYYDQFSGSELRQDSRREERVDAYAHRERRGNEEGWLNSPALREAKKLLISALRLRRRIQRIQPPRCNFEIISFFYF